MKFDKLCELIRSIHDIPYEILPDSLLSNDLGLCSFDMMLLLFHIEEITHCQIAITLLNPGMTVSEFLDIINDVCGGVYG